MTIFNKMNFKKYSNKLYDTLRGELRGALYRKINDEFFNEVFELYRGFSHELDREFSHKINENLSNLNNNGNI